MSKNINMVDALHKTIYNQDQKIAKLEAKLAEKDAEIKQLKLDLGMFKSVNEFLNNYGIKKAREVLLQTEKTKYQDKISFALERLEKIDKFTKSGYCFDLFDVRNEIDNQIKQLKEGK